MSAPAYEDIGPWERRDGGIRVRCDLRESGLGWVARDHDGGVHVWVDSPPDWEDVSSREAADARLRELYPPRTPAPSHAWTTDGRWSHLRIDGEPRASIYHAGPGHWTWLRYARPELALEFSTGISPTTAGARHSAELALGLITEEAPHDQAEGGDVGMSAPLGQVVEPACFDCGQPCDPSSLVCDACLAAFGALPSTPALDAHGLPAHKIPGIEDAIAAMVIEPLPEPATSCVRRSELAELTARVKVLEGLVSPTNLELGDLRACVQDIQRRLRAGAGGEARGPIAPPLGEHHERVAERKAVVAWLRALDQRAGIPQESAVLADDIERGDHLTVKP